MLRRPAHIKLFGTLMWTSVTLLAGPAFAQSQPTRPDGRQTDVLREVESLKAENAVVRDLLRKMEEQQKSLLEQVDRLQRRLDGVTSVAPQERSDCGTGHTSTFTILLMTVTPSPTEIAEPASQTYPQPRNIEFM